jgi:hypothetical protein
MAAVITDQSIIRRLEENGVPYAVLELQDGVSIIISQLGGRIYGPFLRPGASSIYWVPDAFADPADCGQLLRSSWNLGGERLWVAPEIQYLCKYRNDYSGSSFMPPEMDPGGWILRQFGPRRWQLRQEMTLEAFNLALGRKHLHIETLINPVADPLRHLGSYDALTEGVVYAGYQQTVTISEGTHDDILSAAWNLIQVRPGGEVFVPISPGAEMTDYIQPIDSSLFEVHPDSVRVKITGRRQFKVGYKASHVTGRFAYLNQMEDGRAYLLVRCFFSNPSSEYPEEPPGMPGRRGDSIHLYNDDGGLGGFGELECQGQTIGGSTGISASTDPFVVWLYLGTEQQLRLIAGHLLGIQA